MESNEEMQAEIVDSDLSTNLHEECTTCVNEQEDKGTVPIQSSAFFAVTNFLPNAECSEGSSVYLDSFEEIKTNLDSRTELIKDSVASNYGQQESVTVPLRTDYLKEADCKEYTVSPAGSVYMDSYEDMPEELGTPTEILKETVTSSKERQETDLVPLSSSDFLTDNSSKDSPEGSISVDSNEGIQGKILNSFNTKNTETKVFEHQKADKLLPLNSDFFPGTNFSTCAESHKDSPEGHLNMDYIEGIPARILDPCTNLFNETVTCSSERQEADLSPLPSSDFLTGSSSCANIESSEGSISNDSNEEMQEDILDLSTSVLRECVTNFSKHHKPDRFSTPNTNIGNESVTFSNERLEAELLPLPSSDFLTENSENHENSPEGSISIDSNDEMQENVLDLSTTMMKECVTNVFEPRISEMYVPTISEFLAANNCSADAESPKYSPGGSVRTDCKEEISADTLHESTNLVKGTVSHIYEQRKTGTLTPPNSDFLTSTNSSANAESRENSPEESISIDSNEEMQGNILDSCTTTVITERVTNAFEQQKSDTFSLPNLDICAKTSCSTNAVSREESPEGSVGMDFNQEIQKEILDSCTNSVKENATCFIELQKPNTPPSPNYHLLADTSCLAVPDSPDGSFNKDPNAEVQWDTLVPSHFKENVTKDFEHIPDMHPPTCSNIFADANYLAAVNRREILNADHNEDKQGGVFFVPPTNLIKEYVTNVLEQQKPDTVVPPNSVFSTDGNYSANPNSPKNSPEGPIGIDTNKELHADNVGQCTNLVTELVTTVYEQQELALVPPPISVLLTGTNCSANSNIPEDSPERPIGIDANKEIHADNIGACANLITELVSSLYEQQEPALVPPPVLLTDTNCSENAESREDITEVLKSMGANGEVLENVLDTSTTVLKECETSVFEHQEPDTHPPLCSNILADTNSLAVANRRETSSSVGPSVDVQGDVFVPSTNLIKEYVANVLEHQKPDTLATPNSVLLTGSNCSAKPDFSQDSPEGLDAHKEIDADNTDSCTNLVTELVTSVYEQREPELVQPPIPHLLTETNCSANADGAEESLNMDPNRKIHEDIMVSSTTIIRECLNIVYEHQQPDSLPPQCTELLASTNLSEHFQLNPILDDINVSSANAHQLVADRETDDNTVSCKDECTPIANYSDATIPDTCVRNPTTILEHCTSKMASPDDVGPSLQDENSMRGLRKRIWPEDSLQADENNTDILITKKKKLEGCDKKENINSLELSVEKLEQMSSEEQEQMELDDNSQDSNKKGDDFIQDPVIKKFIFQIQDNYKLIKKVGYGSFSTVYLAESIKQKDKKVAIKIMNNCEPDIIANEIQVLNCLRGKASVCQLLDVTHFESVTALTISYHQSAPFLTYYKLMKNTDIAIYFKQLFQALEHLHKLKIIHRDIKPANYLYDKKSRRGILIDFGLAQYTNDIQTLELKYLRKKSKMVSALRSRVRHLERMGEIRSVSRSPSRNSAGRQYEHCLCTLSKAVCKRCIQKIEVCPPRAGTPGYRAPEVVLGAFKQSCAIDMWSCGVILLAIVTRKYPVFSAGDDMNAVKELTSLYGTANMKILAFRNDLSIEFGVRKLALDIKKVAKFTRVKKKREKISIPKILCCKYCKENCEGNVEGYCMCEDVINNINLVTEYSDLAYDLLEKLLDFDPFKRVTPTQALKHPFILKYANHSFKTKSTVD